MSVRHAYYRAFVAGIVNKNDAGYVMVQRALVKMRAAGMIPYSWITDSTRWCHRIRTYGDLGDLLAETAGTSLRTLWSSVDYRVEIWCESESIAGVLTD